MISPEQCRAARAWLGWSQDDLAKIAQVALSTVRDFERGDREPIGHNLDAIKRALERGGINFESGTDSLAGITYNPRVKESDTYVPILKMLIERPDGFLKTSEIIKALENWFPLSTEDNEILEGRADTRFSQIVRNVVSHRSTKTNLIGAGLAEYDKVRRGLRITKRGSDWLTEYEAREKTGP
jgi:transcriptional regulator with XRE-family HTH domain